jgi:hypothetical protein
MKNYHGENLFTRQRECIVILIKTFAMRIDVEALKVKRGKGNKRKSPPGEKQKAPP